MKFNKWLLGIACFLLMTCSLNAQTTVTNQSGGTTTTTGGSQNLLGPSTVTNIISSVPDGVKQVGTDGYNVFKNFSLTNPISAGVVGIKNGKHYGFGLEANTVSTNSAVNAGFGVFAIQTDVPKTATMKASTKWQFFDATLNLSVSKIETVPVLNIPIILRIFSGPFVSLNGGTMIGEQSGATGDFNFQVGTDKYIDFGGGIINASGAAAKGLATVMPMAHFNYTMKF